MVSDEELAAKIKYGDKAALDILVRRYHVPIHSYLIRMGLEYNLVDDIVQEVFIKLIRGIQGYDATKHFKPWLYTIASNAYKDHFKKAYVQHDVLLPNIADNNTCADDPEKIFIQQEEKEHVITALQRLSEAHRETVILRYYQDLKLDEIALVLNIPPGTVKSRLSNALRQLKKWLAKGAVTYNGNKTV